MTRLLFVVVALLVSMAPIGAARQDSMAAARELYATAAYDEALAMLDRLRGATPAPATADARTIEQFRAYSLFALGRAADAEKAVEAVVTIDPTWEIADTEAPPRIVALFANVRARALPNLVRERFNAAKALHAEKKYDEAISAFTRLLTLLEQPSVVKASGRDLADLRIVASGFRDLSKAAAEQALLAATPPPPPQPVAPAPSAAPGNGTGSSGAPSKAAETVADPVLPPSIITQQIPRPVGMAVPLSGESIVIMDVLIDEVGKVERAAIRQSVNRAYEAQLLAAARAWRYTPATQSGKPVKYVKTIEITLSAR
jgi:TonB family protein